MERTQVGPFQILEKLGANRRQRVFRARQVEQNREVVLKFISIPPKYDRATALEKLNYEFTILRTLRHPNLVRTYGAGVDGDDIFLATEFIEGESLGSILSRRGRMAADQVVDVARQISLCLEYLHSQSLIHSKLTPDKILLDKQGNVLVSDLRLNRAKKRRWDNMRHRDAELAAYLAPEQLTGFATDKSDIYSLGTIMYEMLTGRLPFPPENIARLTRRKLEDKIESVATQVLSCPIWLDRLVMQMIDPAPRKRPHSAHAVRLSLEEIARIDATNRSALDELSGSFNPLHINMDKAEARALMDKSVGGANRTVWNWLNILALTASLVLVVLLMSYLLIPESNQQIIRSAERLLISRNPDDWGSARQKLTALLEATPSDADRARAEELILSSRRKTLLEQAKNGVSNALQSEAVRAFVNAYSFEQQNEFRSAYEGYQRILNAEPHQKAEPFVMQEAEAGRERTVDLQILPNGSSAISNWIKNASIQTQAEKEMLLKTLVALIDRFEGDPRYNTLLESATKRLEELQKKPEVVPNEPPKGD
ncbi:MAG: serine/threonine-protein kinase [Pirellulaceae bacterium]